MLSYYGGYSVYVNWVKAEVKWFWSKDIPLFSDWFNGMKNLFQIK